MIIPNVEERLGTIVNRLKEWRIVKEEFLPVVYTDKVEDKQVLPTHFEGWKTFDAPYTLFQQETYFWFKASFTISRQHQNQKAYFRLDNHIDGHFEASSIRPQGLIYLNGKLVQGIDINHGEVFLEDGWYEMYLLFYSHSFERYLPMDFSVTYVDARIVRNGIPQAPFRRGLEVASS